MKRIVLAVFALLCILTFGGCSQEKEAESTTIQDPYTYRIVDKGVQITKSHLTDQTEIIVPDTIAGYPVISIGDEAFYQHTITKSIILPDCILEIGNAAFYRCYSLLEIYIPKSVERMGPNPFFRCSSLENIFVDTGNQYFSDIGGVLFGNDETEMLSYPEGRTDEKEYSIPESVITLKNPFGYDPNFVILTIPSSVTNFPDYNMFTFPDDIVLNVDSGSAAECYALEYGLNYTVLP